MAVVYRIHPSIGIARVGDSPTGFFIGPERPGAAARRKYKDEGGRVLRQAARFRIFAFEKLPGGRLGPGREVRSGRDGVVRVEWTVHLANRKAEFFQFDGLKGEPGKYHGGADMQPRPRRNRVAPEKEWAIDPGPRSIESGGRPVRFDVSSGGQWPEDERGQHVIDYLGELRTRKDRLLVLGGRGRSGSTVDPPAPLHTYANNPDWLDDMSDGPVTAKVIVRKKGGAERQIDIGDEGYGWVIVAPPDFAPEITNIVTLWDVLCDMAVRKMKLPDWFGGELAWIRQLNEELFGKDEGLLESFRPDYRRDVFPILDRAVQYRWVHARAAHAHVDLLRDPRLANRSPQNRDLRTAFLSRVREPGGAEMFAGRTMPRLLGDEPYEDFPQAPGRRRHTVTPTQYAILQRWRDGEFNAPRVSPPIPGERPGPPPGREPTPFELDRAALEACAGGAFYPGIEVGWQIRHEDLFIAPFRIHHGAPSTYLYEDEVVRAGHFTRQMALPWQADFADCKQEDEDDIGTTWGWWPAQRPDEVAVGQGPRQTWTRSRAGGNADALDDDAERHRWMVDHWAKLGFVMRKGRSSEEFEETERDPDL